MVGLGTFHSRLQTIGFYTSDGEKPSYSRQQALNLILVLGPQDYFVIREKKAAD